MGVVENKRPEQFAMASAVLMAFGAISVPSLALYDFYRRSGYGSPRYLLTAAVLR